MCIHGLGDYSGWFCNIAPELAADGNEVYALDLRGFGESVLKGQQRGCVEDFQRHLQDIDDFIMHLHSHHGGKKLFLFGHSLGGVYSIWYAANHPTSIEGLVLAAPAVACNINSTYLDERRDPEEIKIMREDPLETWTLPADYLLKVQALLLDSVFGNASKVFSPTLILQGEADVTVHPEGAKRLFVELAVADKKLELFADAGHWLYDALSPAPPRNKCEVAKREQFIGTIKDWLRNY